MLANGLSLYLTCTHTILIQLEKSFKPSFVWPKLHQAWISCWGKRKRTIMRYGNQQPTEWSEHMHKILYVYIGCRWLTKKIFTHIHKNKQAHTKKKLIHFLSPFIFLVCRPCRGNEHWKYLCWNWNNSVLIFTSVSFWMVCFIL